MHINSSGENYLETILILSKKRPVVRSVDIATELDFKKSQRKCGYEETAYKRTYNGISGRIY